MLSHRAEYLLLSPLLVFYKLMLRLLDLHKLFVSEQGTQSLAPALPPHDFPLCVTGLCGCGCLGSGGHCPSVLYTAPNNNAKAQLHAAEAGLQILHNKSVP